YCRAAHRNGGIPGKISLEPAEKVEGARARDRIELLGPGLGGEGGRALGPQIGAEGELDQVGQERRQLLALAGQDRASGEIDDAAEQRVLGVRRQGGALGLGTAALESGDAGENGLAEAD